MTARCTNVTCPSPAVHWDGRIGAWVHQDTGERSCHLPDAAQPEGFIRRMPPLAQQRSRLPDQLFWYCSLCGTWVRVRSLQEGAGGLYARCYGPAAARHEPTTWASAEGLELPVDTPPLPEPRRAPEPPEEVTWEYGIEYHYSPGRWHVLPNLIITDRAEADRELVKRQRSFGEGGKHAYRLLTRRAAGTWSEVPS